MVDRYKMKFAPYEGWYEAGDSEQLDTDDDQELVLASEYDTLAAELADSQAKQRALVEEVSLWKENHKFASKLADDLTQDGIKERDRIRALEAALREMRKHMSGKSYDTIVLGEIINNALATAETPIRQVHSKSEYKRLTALGVECVVTVPETKGVKSE